MSPIKTSRTHWVSTGLLGLLLTASALSYLVHEGTIVGLAALGFPNFFRIQLAVLKLLATVVLVVPTFGRDAKQWAYAGVGLFLVTAIVAHTAHGDSPLLTVINLTFFGLLVVSQRSLPR